MTKDDLASESSRLFMLQFICGAKYYFCNLSKIPCPWLAYICNLINHGNDGHLQVP